MNLPGRKKGGSRPCLSQKQVSAGGVVFKKCASEICISLILRDAGEREVWCLPKGHVERGESFEEAAVREVREETGILARIVKPLRDIRYSFFDHESKSRIFKTVHFFLMECQGGALEDHDDEVKRVEWVPVSRVLLQMCYPSEREVVELAMENVNQSG